eukprot:scaffold266124_cov75-Attheya_sp.AAC.1
MSTRNYFLRWRGCFEYPLVVSEVISLECLDAHGDTELVVLGNYVLIKEGAAGPVYAHRNILEMTSDTTPIRLAIYSKYSKYHQYHDSRHRETSEQILIVPLGYKNQYHHARRDILL